MEDALSLPNQQIGLVRLAQLDNIRVYRLPEPQLLYVDWLGFQYPGQVAEGCELVLRHLQACGASGLLNDNTRVQGSWDQEVDWLVRDWFPRANAAGLRNLAWIYSPSIFSQISTNRTNSKLSVAITVQLFQDLPSAYAWLQAQP